MIPCRAASAEAVRRTALPGLSGAGWTGANTIRLAAKSAFLVVGAEQPGGRPGVGAAAAAGDQAMGISARNR